MRAKLKLRSKILVSALMVLFIVSIIPVLAGKGERADVTITVTVVGPLIADAGGPYFGLVGSPVSFDGSGSFGSEEIVKYDWDFGDRTIGTGVKPSHIYTVADTYTITLTVTDEDGATDIDTAEVTVSTPPPISPPVSMGSANKKPIADAGPDQEVYVDEAVNFDGSGSYDPDGSIMSWTWDFGDGEKDSGETASHTYSETGVYMVTLTVKDYRNTEASDTCIITATEEAEITPPTPRPAEFILSDLSITPAEVEPREEVTITFLVTNVGEETGTCTVNLSVEGEPMTVLVTLDGGESEEVEFKLSPEAEGTYQVVVDGLTGSFTVKLPPVPLKPAEFIISGFTVSPIEVPTGEAVTVSVTIKNIGEVTGTHILEIMVDGDTPEGPPIETVLEGGASTTITINVIEEEPKEHTVKVDGLTEVFTVTAPPGFVLSPGYIAGILILIIIAGTTTYTLYRRRQTGIPPV